MAAVARFDDDETAGGARAKGGKGSKGSKGGSKAQHNKGGEGLGKKKKSGGGAFETMGELCSHLMDREGWLGRGERHKQSKSGQTRRYTWKGERDLERYTSKRTARRWEKEIRERE